MHLNNLKSALPVLKALNSEVRINLIYLLLEENGLNMNEIAKRLELSNGAITMHIKKLEESGLIQIHSSHAKNGIQKKVFLIDDKLTIDFKQEKIENLYEVEIGIGQYMNYNVTPTCGMATRDKIIGEFDSPQVFADPQHTNSQILWFTSGFIEYWIPNYTSGKDIKELQISFELGSEAPYHNVDWPSTIEFYLNDLYVGFWESPSDIGGMKYHRNPDWWPPHLNQYGFLKLLRINETGTFIDGRKISSTSITDLQIDDNEPLNFKFKVSENSEQAHGLTLFGKDFGKYEQDILVRVITE